MVRTAVYSIKILKVQWMQKLSTATIEDPEPARKAKAFVNEVIVIEGPAWYIALLIRFDAG